MTEAQTHAPVPAQPTKKRTRTISNLTEKQIRQKREVDRKAQRAFRQRAKDCLANLEHQHLQLQQTSRETEAQLRRELEVLQGQNYRLLRCLADIVDVASTIRNEYPNEAVASGQNAFHSGQHTNESRGPASCRSSQNEIERRSTPRTIRRASGSSSSQYPALEPGVLPIPNPERETIHISPQELTQTSNYHQQDIGVSYDHSIQPESANIGNALDSYPAAPSEAVNNVHLEISHDDELNDVGSHLESLENLGILFPATAGVQAAPANHEVAPSAPDNVPASDSVTFGCSTTVGADAPSQLLPTCPLDQIMLDFIRSRRDMLSQGSPLTSVIGPEKPTVKAVINPSLCASAHGLSNILSEILSAFSNVRQTEKLALFYVMYKSMRWQTTRTREDYLAMPSWLRPTVTQATVPHAAWIDNIPWPDVRDILIKDAPDEQFFERYSQNVSVNWEFDDDDAMADMSGEVLLHSIFEKHINHLQNWSVSSEFQLHYPRLAQAILSESPGL